jgi:hypothetical protein
LLKMIFNSTNIVGPPPSYATRQWKVSAHARAPAVAVFASRCRGCIRGAGWSSAGQVRLRELGGRPLDAARAPRERPGLVTRTGQRWVGAGALGLCRALRLGDGLVWWAAILTLASLFLPLAITYVPRLVAFSAALAWALAGLAVAVPARHLRAPAPASSSAASSRRSLAVGDSV